MILFFNKIKIYNTILFMLGFCLLNSSCTDQNEGYIRVKTKPNNITLKNLTWEKYIKEDVKLRGKDDRVAMINDFVTILAKGTIKNISNEPIKNVEIKYKMNGSQNNKDWEREKNINCSEIILSQRNQVN